MQTRLDSFIEACANTCSGYFVSLLVWLYIAMPYIGMERNLEDGLVVTGIFTVTSILRSYLWRRLFNWWTQRKLRFSITEH